LFVAFVVYTPSKESLLAQAQNRMLPVGAGASFTKKGKQNCFWGVQRLLYLIQVLALRFNQNIILRRLL
jgi:hypothetical protein